MVVYDSFFERWWWSVSRMLFLCPKRFGSWSGRRSWDFVFGTFLIFIFSRGSHFVFFVFVVWCMVNIVVGDSCTMYGSVDMKECGRIVLGDERCEIFVISQDFRWLSIFVFSHIRFSSINRGYVYLLVDFIVVKRRRSGRVRRRYFLMKDFVRIFDRVRKNFRVSWFDTIFSI